MRCPRCYIEFNSKCERCPNCGLPSEMARPDGDTLERVRRNNSIVMGEDLERTSDELYTSFSPVLKFDKPIDEEETFQDNPADNFEDIDFQYVNIQNYVPENDVDGNGEADSSELRHRVLSREIHRLANNKDDDLLAEYYFKDGISELERYNLERSFARVNSEISVNDLDKDKSQSDVDFIADYISQKTGEDNASDTPTLKFSEEEGLNKYLDKGLEHFENVGRKIKKFFYHLYHDVFGKYYRRFDAVTCDNMDKFLVKVYYSRFSDLKRKSADSPSQKRKLRKKVWGGVCCFVFALMIALALFVNSMTDAVTGKWIVSYDAGNKPNIIMEFSSGGKAAIKVKSDDGWHVHKKGSYKTQRKNGHDLLVITYEDGSVSRLYYVIDRREGTFTNVETNVESVYKLK